MAVFTDLRSLEVLEAVLSYASSNVDDINVAFHTGRPEPDGRIIVGGEYRAPLTEPEVEALLEVVRADLG